MLLYGWRGAASRAVNEHARHLVNDLAVGGVIVMERNVGTPEQLRSVTAELQEMALQLGRPPLFVAVDQEGGRVNRLRTPHFVEQPCARQIGDTNDPSVARQSAAAIAAQLREVGIRWDFAPVLDVNINPDNPVIGDRAYGDNAKIVAAMGSAAVLGFQDDGGLLACGKHFPGHGDTDVDSHLALPTIPHNRVRLDRVELPPFRAAIAAGLGAIMTAHIVYRELDPNVPATMSRAVLTGLLRTEMGFGGIIITDCLEMRGVAARWGSAEAAVSAVEAGADILLCCHTLSTQVAIRDAVCAAVNSGRIPESRIDESLSRIAIAKSRWIPGPNN